MTTEGQLPCQGTRLSSCQSPGPYHCLSHGRNTVTNNGHPYDRYSYQSKTQIFKSYKYEGSNQNLHIKQYCPPKSGENLRLTLTWSSTKCLYAVY